MLWLINNIPLPPSLQYIIICYLFVQTNKIGHNDPEVVSNGLINLARYKEKVRRIVLKIL